MATNTSDTTLFRIEPAQNMLRFYSMTIQPNLFGGYSLMRTWGRIGSVGQMRVDLHETEAGAMNERSRILKAKERRGYRHTKTDAHNLTL